MTQSCSVCNSSQRLEIDRELVGRKSISSLSRKYGLTNDALTRHRKNHLSRQLIQAKQARDLFVSKNMYSLIDDLLNSSLNILKKTESDPTKYGVALKAISESRKTCEFLFETSIALKEIQIEEKQQEIEKHSEQYDLSLLSLEELKTLKRLYQKAEGKNPGRRTDLENITRARIRQDKHRRKKLAAERLNSDNPVEPVKRKLKRRKVEPELIDEFDAMRDRLGISNQPELPKQRQWTDPY